jgi:hypothetical protein
VAITTKIINPIDLNGRYSDITESSEWDRHHPYNPLIEPLPMTKELQEKTQFEAMLDAELSEIRTMLLAKNAAYGNSALDPIRVFSRVDKLEQLRVRMDDKLSRLARGAACDEDVVLDLLGYLLIYRIAQQGL